MMKQHFRWVLFLTLMISLVLVGCSGDNQGGDATDKNEDKTTDETTDELSLIHISEPTRRRD